MTGNVLLTEGEAQRLTISKRMLDCWRDIAAERSAEIARGTSARS